MARLFGLVIILWLVIFAFRIIQIGGIDPTYRDSENQLFKPFQEHLAGTINQLLPYPQSSLLSGILLGASDKLPFSFKQDLKDTSTIHMVVVSGQNLSIVAGFFVGLVYLIGRRKTIVISILALVFYSLLTGLQVPVLRASIMVLLSYLAQILGKEKQGWWVLFVTGGGMLIFNPNWLLSISFQLSFLATFGVVVVAPIFTEYLKNVPKVLREDLAVTLAAQVLVLPVIAYNFGQISLIGILSNSLILWSIPIVMISGFISLGVGLVSLPLGQIIGLVPGILLTYFIYIVEFFAKLPGAGLKVEESGMVVWVGYYLLIGALVWTLKTKGDEVKN